MTKSNDLSDGMRRYWDARAQENAVYYVDTTCDYAAPDMEQFFETGKEIVHEALVKAPAQPTERGLALEIVPGLGRICKALSPQFDRVIGLDVSAEMVRRGRELVNEPNVTFEVSDGTTLQPIADASVDFVMTFTVLQHLPDLRAIVGYLQEAARVLRPGGLLAAQWNGDAHPRRYRLRGVCWKVQQWLGVPSRQDNRLAPEFLGTPVPMPIVLSVLEDSGLVVEGTKGKGTLLSWAWARKP
ncbi:MAG: class I SAM-dependent methyltransferase [Acidimicrobiia bacterium]